MVFYTLVLQFYLKNEQKQKRRWYLYEEKNRKKQNSATMIISVDGIGTVFLVKLKLKKIILRNI